MRRVRLGRGKGMEKEAKRRSLDQKLRRKTPEEKEAERAAPTLKPAARRPRRRKP